MKVFYNVRPESLSENGDGSYKYRFNIDEVDGPISETDLCEIDTRPCKQWQCDEVTVYEPLTANKITEAVIASICPATHEQKLVNEYNAANLGMVGGSKTSEDAKKCIAAYKEFLEYRNALKTQVDEDCAELGIK